MKRGRSAQLFGSTMSRMNGHEAEEPLAKRGKHSDTPVSRSATPTVALATPPFKLIYPKKAMTASKKQEIEAQGAEWLISPFEAKHAPKKGALDQYYMVENPHPNVNWENMRRYNNFVIGEDKYTNNEYVYVRSATTPPEQENIESNMKNFWVARILQVRAMDNQHVYALIAWMYWPSELPKLKAYPADQVASWGGKCKYHGANELVASSYLEVLDVLSFAGKADVKQWDEDIDEDYIKSQLYWRQTFCRETQTLSMIRKHCVCTGFFNPDEPMYICDNLDCKTWLHRECIIDDILTKKYSQMINDTNGDTLVKPTAKSTGKAKGGKAKAGKPIVPKTPYAGVFAGAIEEVGDDLLPMITIRDIRRGHQSVRQERISCLKCNTLLEGSNP